MSLLTRYHEYNVEEEIRAFTAHHVQLLDLLLIDAAASTSNAAIEVSRLMSRGASPSANLSHALRNSATRSPILARILLQQGAEIHDKHDDAFWIATHAQNIPVMKVLLFAGANLYTQHVNALAKTCFLVTTPEVTQFFKYYSHLHDILRDSGVSEFFYSFFYASETLHHYCATHRETRLTRAQVFYFAQDTLPSKRIALPRSCTTFDQRIMAEFWKTGTIETLLPDAQKDTYTEEPLTHGSAEIVHLEATRLTAPEPQVDSVEDVLHQIAQIDVTDIPDNFADEKKRPKKFKFTKPTHPSTEKATSTVTPAQETPPIPEETVPRIQTPAPVTPTPQETPVKKTPKTTSSTESKKPSFALNAIYQNVKRARQKPTTEES